ncbi:NADP-dependent isocitrate dehydrogenase [Babesia caballi]|uniref:NADP-dependent isocitrate dehydrogenase n=1 Tax=Babesia caballi TaxID=5871 RepID=A0AAV4LLV2_BABCB|nr:NADP-dependent isocitrate dehydrogenase [Babesia caballi]
MRSRVYTPDSTVSMQAASKSEQNCCRQTCDKDVPEPEAASPSENRGKRVAREGGIRAIVGHRSLHRVVTWLDDGRLVVLGQVSVRVDVSVVVLACPEEAALGSQHVGHHVVELPGFIPQAQPLELGPKLLLVDVVEGALEDAVVGAHLGVFYAHVEWEPVQDAVAEAAACEGGHAALAGVHAEA